MAAPEVLYGSKGHLGGRESGGGYFAQYISLTGEGLVDTTGKLKKPC